ncbi:MAG TPA: inorganic phosphate transporter [Terriglobales bacterium]|nr:inorganic phosphate transporter [Terriglobales bacterium]
MHLNSTLILTAVTVLVALSFDFINGFHDAANSIATVVSTRVLSPKLAVVWAAFFNFAAAFVLGIAVAKTIGKGLIDLHHVTQFVVLAGLLGAIIWDLMTWYWGLPTSSSHALIGGYAGAAIARGGFSVIIPAGWNKTLIFIIVSPLLGFLLGLGLMVATSWILRRATPRQVDRWFRWLQLVSSAGVSLAHGGNDAQKTMGIVAGALFAGGYITQTEMNTDWGPFHYPIIFGAYIAIALGTYFGGWRIIRTMGTKITKLKPVGGFCAETAAAITLMGTALTGIPVSTTHTITGAIVGVGSTQRVSAVRWGVARRIVWAWVLTIPAAALMAAIVFWLIRLVHRGA